jgi:hypothetical protein
MVKEGQEKSTTDRTGIDNKAKQCKSPTFFDKLKVYYTNADTLSSGKKAELVSIINIEHPDIICITEYFPKNYVYEITDETLHIPGYDVTRTGTGRGIAIYTANHLIASKIETTTAFNESLWLNIKISQKHNIIFGGIYRSPNSTDTNNNLLLDLLIEALQIKHDHIIIAGDFNLKDIDWKTREVQGSEANYAHKIFDGINDLFLNETVLDTTRGRENCRGNNKPSALDWVLTENADCVENLIIDSPLGLSDHSTITFDYRCLVERTDSGQAKLSFYNGNYDSMREDLQTCDREIEFRGLNTQSIWDKIESKYSGLIERYIPKKRFLTSQTPVWLNRDIRKLIKGKHKSWNRYRRNPSPENWALYSQCRNTVTHTINKAKSDYEHKLASGVKTNPKKFWQYVNSSVKSKGKINELIDSDGNITTDDQGKADILNNHFASIFTEEDLSDIPSMPIKPNLKLLEDITITTEGIIKHLKRLNISKAAGPDGINARLLRETSEQIAPALKFFLMLVWMKGAYHHSGRKLML